jgi:GTP diphosphokinase / guanosine-3',5'-bis(diphosphate) 3'-diphosphatase
MEQTVHEGIDCLLNSLRETGRNYQFDKIQQAYDYAAGLHAGQRRASGEAYITHPVAVAEIVAGLGLDTDSICAALLHDTVEDCGERTSTQEIAKIFGSDVAMLVDGVTKTVPLQIVDKEEAHIENLRKMLLAMSRDVRVILIKLCDRLHNMRTLDAKPEEKQRLTALETMQVYAPLAHRLGIQKIKQELENLSLKYLDPIGYADVERHIEEKYGQNLDFIDSIRGMVNDKLKSMGLSFTLEGRIKTVYSIYRKMYTQNKSFDEIYDFYAMRVIVNTVTECYTVLGVVHELFKSVPGRFKDYISIPKPNLYRSLHTTVIGRDGIPFEVQIRTWEMHHVAEYGIAAHWKYKAGVTSKEDMDKKLEWIARLNKTEDGIRDPEEFLKALKIDILHDEVFVFTPKGDVEVLPQGATVIDFAYSIHSEVGNRMIGAKINGKIVPIEHVLNTGEIVEIITAPASSGHGPSRDWLSVVKTGDAKNKIKLWFKRERRPENIQVGKGAVDAELKKAAPRLNESRKLELVTAAAQKSGYNTADDLYNAIGYGELQVGKILPKILEELAASDETEDALPATDPAPAEVVTAAPPKHLRSNSGIVVDGVDGCEVKFAKCCNPLPGDKVVGFVTKAHGISIHKADCPKALQGQSNPGEADRWKRAYWEIPEAASNDHSVYGALIQIYSLDVVGVLADVTAVLADMKVSILSVNTQKASGGRAIMNLTVSCKNVDHYNSIVSRLRSLENVVDVGRGFTGAAKGGEKKAEKDV